MAQPSIETILADDHFVRALARRLVRDHAAADDVTQTAYVEALRRLPPDHPAPRGWIATVVRHVASNLGRSEERRARHEQGAARREEVTPESHLLEREEVRRALVAAVLDLGAPRSTVVVMRYFEDLPPRAIARRLGLPVETVRSHLKRAHADLRRRLGAARHRDGGSVLSALPICVGAWGGIWTGFTLMTAKTKLVCAAAVLVVGGLAWIAVPDGDASEPRVASIEPGPAPDLAAPAIAAADPEAGRTSPDQSPEAAASAVARVEAEQAALVLRGRVVDSAGVPVSGAHVRASRLDGRGASFLEQELFERLARRDAIVPPDAVRSGRDGRFELFNLQPNVRYDVAAWHAEFGVVVAPGIPLRTDEPEGVVLQFEPAVILSGRVTDGAGRGLAGADVQVQVSRDGSTFLSFFVARSARDGAWRTPPAKHPHFALRAHAPGHRSERRVLVWAPGRDREIQADFVLAPAPVVRGRFALADGSPARLADELAARGFDADLAEFALLASDEEPVDDGSFRSREHDPASIDWDRDRFEHAASEEPPAFVSLWFQSVLLGAVRAVPDGEVDLVVHLDRLPRPTPRRTIAVRCRDDRDAALDVVRLILKQPLVGEAAPGFDGELAIEDAEPGGTGRIAEGVRVGAYEMLASAPGHAPRLVPLVVEEGPGVQVFDVVLPRADCDVEVLALSAHGAPVDDAVILVLDADGRPVPIPERIATGVDGRAHVRGLGAGEHTILAAHPRLAAHGRRVTLARGTTPVRLDLQEGVEVRVDLVGFHASVYLRATDAAGIVMLEDLGRGTSRGSTVRLRLPLGRHVLLARGRGIGTSTVEIDARPDARVEIRAQR